MTAHQCDRNVGSNLPFGQCPNEADYIVRVPDDPEENWYSCASCAGDLSGYPYEKLDGRGPSQPSPYSGDKTRVRSAEESALLDELHAQDAERGKIACAAGLIYSAPAHYIQNTVKRLRERADALDAALLDLNAMHRRAAALQLRIKLAEKALSAPSVLGTIGDIGLEALVELVVFQLPYQREEARRANEQLDAAEGRISRLREELESANRWSYDLAHRLDCAEDDADKFKRQRDEAREAQSKMHRQLHGQDRPIHRQLERSRRQEMAALDGEAMAKGQLDVLLRSVQAFLECDDRVNRSSGESRALGEMERERLLEDLTTNAERAAAWRRGGQ